jgi:hypothetical protein
MLTENGGDLLRRKTIKPLKWFCRWYYANSPRFKPWAMLYLQQIGNNLVNAQAFSFGLVVFKYAVA